MASLKKEFQMFKASGGHIFSPNFPEPVPELRQLTSCTLSSRCAYGILTLPVYILLSAIMTRKIHIMNSFLWVSHKMETTTQPLSCLEWGGNNKCKINFTPFYICYIIITVWVFPTVSTSTYCHAQFSFYCYDKFWKVIFSKLTIHFLSSTSTEITIHVQYLYLNGVHTNLMLCEQQLQFTMPNESKTTYCSPHLEMGAFQEYFTIPMKGNHVNITFTKCSKSKGGKFWIYFTGMYLSL